MDTLPAVGLALVVLLALAIFMRGLVLCRRAWKSTWRFGRLNVRGTSTEAGPRCLVVFVPGLFPFVSQPWEYDGLLNLLDAELSQRFATRHWLLFRYLATFWSPDDPPVVANRLRDEIERTLSRDSYDQILLLAHSYGGLIVRQTVLGAKERPWFDQVNQVVLLASTSRGLIPATRLQRWLTRIGKWLHVDRLGLARLALSGQKPSDWLDQLATNWRSWLGSRGKMPAIIQIQGDRDRVVHRTDDADLADVPGFREEILSGVGHRYFLLKERWLDQCDPAIQATRDAVCRAVR